MMRIFRIVLGLFLVAATAGMTAETAETKRNAAKDPDFRKYWYQGKAELTRYSLEQSRYGEIHKGEAVLIFVTEPFLRNKQVKLDHGKDKNAISVLKLNFTRKFFTGIYPYSMMTSVFIPVDSDEPHPLKVSSSVQEWCGHTYSQLNFANGAYRGLLHSYFQDEADQNFELKRAWLEDEIWSRIRMAPDTLPVGDLEIIPSLQYARLKHHMSKVEKATGTLQSQEGMRVYSLEFPNLKRRVVIRFEPRFPYAIVSWEESGPGGFRSDSPILTTKAVRAKSLLLDYWNRNGNEDAHYREKLGLTSW